MQSGQWDNQEELSVSMDCCLESLTQRRLVIHHTKSARSCQKLRKHRTARTVGHLVTQSQSSVLKKAQKTSQSKTHEKQEKPVPLLQMLQDCDAALLISSSSVVSKIKGTCSRDDKIKESLSDLEELNKLRCKQVLSDFEFS